MKLRDLLKMHAYDSEAGGSVLIGAEIFPEESMCGTKMLGKEVVIISHADGVEFSADKYFDGFMNHEVDSFGYVEYEPLGAAILIILKRPRDIEWN